MKVLQTLRTLERGGAEVLALDVCQNAVANGLDLTFATFLGGSMENEFKATGLDYYDLEKGRGFDPILVYKLRKLCRDKNMQIIHTNQPTEAIYSYLATIGTNIKVVMTYHGAVPNSKLIRHMNFLIPRLDANIFCSHFMLEYYAEMEGLRELENVKIIYNGVSEDRLESYGNSIKEELGLTDENTIMAMVCNFRPPVKDQFTICQALPKVFEKNKDAHFLFAGGPVLDGGEEMLKKCIDYCHEKGISDRVHFLGSRPDVPDVLKEVDLFVFSSLHEGFPIAVIEAMLSRIPLILSDIKPFIEITENGQYAELFPTRDPEKLAEAITKFLENEPLRKELADKTFKYAKANFTMESHIKNLKALYQTLI